ncbi:ATP-binding protein, partial [Ellagibacter isourolithinifaciens]|uniref:ATP-binding protein n=1 Tax=Ellagibacter isourolithinifaciens TaxID=2137581 RepID=UPI003AEF5180
EIMKRHKEGARNHLFIDEVQLCEGFEKAINSIHTRGGWDVYLTGSNAFLLSSDLATLFTGRHREVHILPFSFVEYRSYFGEQGTVGDDFDRFIRRGGLAGSYDYDDISESYGYIRDVFVFYEAKRYDIKGKKYLSTQAKHYVCDSGMRYAVLGTRDMDWGRMYENAVFLELMRRGYETYVGKLYQKEVDFVAKRGSELVYIQVSDDISFESTLERELAPLLSVRDAFPKVLIARTRHEPYTREGVLVLDLARWLLGEQGF